MHPICAKTSVNSKKSPNVYKSSPKMILPQKFKIWHLYKNCLRMWEIWAIYLPPKTLKSCPKSHKLPHLVTLAQRRLHQIPMALLSQSNFKSFLFFSLEKAKTKLVLYLYHQFRLTAVIVRKLIKSSVCVIASHFLQHSVGKIHTHHR